MSTIVCAARNEEMLFSTCNTWMCVQLTTFECFTIQHPFIPPLFNHFSTFYFLSTTRVDDVNRINVNNSIISFFFSSKESNGSIKFICWMLVLALHLIYLNVRSFVPFLQSHDNGDCKQSVRWLLHRSLTIKS